MATTTLPFKPKQVVKKLLSSLHERARLVMIKRYGLDKNAERMTLEVHHIGKSCVFTGELVKCLQVTSVLEEIKLMTQVEV